MDWLATFQLIGLIWAGFFLALIPWSYFNQDKVSVGELVLGIVFAPFCFLACYGDWHSTIIVWRRKDK